MTVTFLSENSQFTVFFLLPTYQSKKNIFHSHIQDMACEHTRQFLSKVSALSLALKSGLRTFFPNGGINSRSHILFVIYGDAIYNVVYFFQQITITTIRCGHPAGLKQAKCFGKGREIRKTRKDRGVKIAEIDFENIGSGKMSLMSRRPHAISWVGWKSRNDGIRNPEFGIFGIPGINKKIKH